MTSTSLLWLLAATALVVGITGAAYTWRSRAGRTLEQYITARSSIGGMVAGMSLFASGMGSWILFGPAEAATWGGVPNIVGYAVGSALPLVLFIWIGRRVRRLMPRGHALTEYVQLRFGRAMHLLTLAVMAFYLFIFLSAEVTGLALMVNLAAGTPLWVSAGTVLLATLLYTTIGGLRASIFTDGLQTALILPVGAVLVVAAIYATGGTAGVYDAVAEARPELLDAGFLPGLGGAVTLLIAMAAAGLFDQAIWQRVYAVRSDRALRTGFLVAAFAVIPVVLAMGWFGLVAVATETSGEPSLAFYHVVAEQLPPAFVWCLLVLGVLLVMSSADSIINGIAGLLSVEAHRLYPSRSASELLPIARASTVVLSVPVFLIAMQGYSVLYLFLVADLLCAAAVVPVFAGFRLKRLSNRRAITALVTGLATGVVLLPGPEGGQALIGTLLPATHPLAAGNLLLSFLSAVIIPLIFVLFPGNGPPFDFHLLESEVNEIQ